jgi:hypothetical protein
MAGPIGRSNIARIKPFSKHKAEGFFWTGLPQVLKELNRQVKAVEDRTVGGMAAAALIVKKDAVILAPIDTGNLRNSSYTIWGGKDGTKSNKAGSGKFRSKGKGNEGVREAARFDKIVAERSGQRPSKPFAEIGFTASYALVVHEDLTAFRNKGQAKFLERSLFENKAEVLRQIRMRASIK